MKCAFLIRWQRLIFAAIIACLGTAAVAHPAPFSYLDLQLEPEGVRGSFVIHNFDAAHELKVGQPEVLLTTEGANAHYPSLLQYLAGKLKLMIDDAPAIVEWDSLQILSERQSLKFNFHLDIATPGKIELDLLPFPYDPAHQAFVNIYESGQLKRQAILDTKQHTVTYFTGTTQGRWAVFGTFLKQGVHHILIGPDHVLFLLGLLLLGGTWRRLLLIVTAFTLGHSVTLSLAALGIVHLTPNIIEPLIALSIVVVGADTLLVHRKRIAAPNDTRDLRPWFAGIFGLVHGFGFAYVLAEFGLPREALALSLASFNLGVEAGQLVIVTAALGATWLLFKTFPTRRAAILEPFLTLGSIFVIAAGVYWFAQRIGLLSTLE